MLVCSEIKVLLSDCWWLINQTGAYFGSKPIGSQNFGRHILAPQPNVRATDLKKISWTKCNDSAIYIL
jgi:hypothetical protein